MVFGSTYSKSNFYFIKVAFEIEGAIPSGFSREKMLVTCSEAQHTAAYLPVCLDFTFLYCEKYSISV